MAKPNDVKNAGMPDFSKFVETATGFPPYWKATPGAKFFGKVVGIDIREGTFPRYTLIAGMPLDCATGPSDDATPVKVQAGDRFTTSIWAGLPLDRFMNEEVLVEAVKKSRGGAGDIWTFKVMSTPEVKAIAASRQSIFEWNGGGKPTLAATIPAYLLNTTMTEQAYNTASAALNAHNAS
jgi:hypothetical protein